MSKLLKERNIGAVPHGFRSSFRSWCADTDTSPRSTDNTTCNFRSGLWDGLDISISLHQTQPRPEQDSVTRDKLGSNREVSCWLGRRWGGVFGVAR